MSLQGRLEDLSLSDLFQIISVSHRTGVLTISGPGDGRVVFHEGHILYASVFNQEKLGERLIRKKLIQEPDLEVALKIQKSRRVYEPLGTILAENKAVSPDILETVIREQVKEVISELLSWGKGDFRFEEEKKQEKAVSMEQPREILLGDGISTEYLLLEGARLQDEEQLEEDDLPASSPLSESTPPKSENPNRMPDLSLFKELMASRNLAEVQLMVLRFAGEFLNRVLIFSVQKDQIFGVGQSGFPQPDGGGETIRKIRIPLRESSVFEEALKMGSYKGILPDCEWNRYLVFQLGGKIPGEVFVSALMGESGVEAFLYGDDLPERRGIGSTEEIEVFIQVAGIVLKNMKCNYSGV